MIIGAVRCELFIYEAGSLKAKRAVIKSLLVRLGQRYNLSVAETGYQDLWQRAELSIVVVSTTKKRCDQELQKALALIDADPDSERTLTQMDWL
ncbi:DUF503 domain-containing protein [Alkalicoccobacillus murimartini]|jgi:hypothetical protein|uniref:Uncharacterized protein YlxP (DUF503 family) n=1 Tax=Alkalicoccobacillus murimartini TaxID=171685 RepID=A0ABT9YEM0_9BACI|nr:DUF503 family protein [Alkalicoccobacillus murimartini]MDQ0206303.1 uncharacterized protein YlxP (DUF503 family) [Alkalicoccobacillus murimartini]